MSSPEIETRADLEWIYSVPPNPSKTTWLLTKGKTAVKGSWANTVGAIAWFPIPKRNKELEEELGL